MGGLFGACDRQELKRESGGEELMRCVRRQSLYQVHVTLIQGFSPARVPAAQNPTINKRPSFQIVHHPNE